jgi:chemotaxis-related protein WspB
MLMLLFYVGGDRYALDTKRVVEVIPRVTLKKVYHAPEYIAGLFNYRGCLVPVIDFCHLINGSPSNPYLSTRIILINCQGSNLSQPQSNNEVSITRILGLMAERVTDTLNKSEREFINPGIKVDDSPYLGEMITDEQGMIQFLKVENLFPDNQYKNLLIPSVEY